MITSRKAIHFKKYGQTAHAECVLPFYRERVKGSQPPTLRPKLLYPVWRVGTVFIE